MNVIKSHRIVMFDVDDTLVIWDWKQYDPNGVKLIKVEDPEGKCFQLVMPHDRHVELMKQFKARGHTIVVWSQGGWAWAENVVKALGIESIVDIVMDKPSWYVDDLPASAYMGNPIFLDPKNPTKDKRWGSKNEEP